MEYSEETFKESKSLVDTSKVQLINSLGRTWIQLECSEGPDQEVCQQKKELAYNYGNDFMKVQAKMMECEKYLEELDFTPFASREFEKCISLSERYLRVTIESYYEKFVSLNK